MAFPNDGQRFVPGISGNPNGRPKNRSVTARLREFLESDELGGRPIGNGRQVADLLTETIGRAALKGDFRFIQLLLDRTEAHEELTERIAALEEALRLAAGGRPVEGGGDGVPGADRPD